MDAFSVVSNRRPVLYETVRLLKIGRVHVNCTAINYPRCQYSSIGGGLGVATQDWRSLYVKHILRYNGFYIRNKLFWVVDVVHAIGDAMQAGVT